MTSRAQLGAARGRRRGLYARYEAHSDVAEALDVLEDTLDRGTSNSPGLVDAWNETCVPHVHATARLMSSSGIGCGISVRRVDVASS